MQFTCVKLVEAQVGPLFTVWAPMGIAALLLYPVVLREKDGGRFERQDIVPILLLAALGILPAQLLYTIGTLKSLASNAALLTLTLPVFTAVLAVIILGEKMTGLRWISFAAAILGVLACSITDLRHMNLGGGYLMGNLLILGGVLGSSFYNSYGKKILERMSPMRLLFYTYVTTLVLMAPWVWGHGAIQFFEHCSLHHPHLDRHGTAHRLPQLPLHGALPHRAEAVGTPFRRRSATTSSRPSAYPSPRWCSVKSWARRHGWAECWCSSPPSPLRLWKTG